MRSTSVAAPLSERRFGAGGQNAGHQPDAPAREGRNPFPRWRVGLVCVRRFGTFVRQLLLYFFSTGTGTRASRKPTVRSRTDGASPLRAAARQSEPLSDQLPPRTT